MVLLRLALHTAALRLASSPFPLVRKKFERLIRETYRLLQVLKVIKGSCRLACQLLLLYTGSAHLLHNNFYHNEPLK
jgi:hypothetical protein